MASTDHHRHHHGHEGHHHQHHEYKHPHMSFKGLMDDYYQRQNDHEVMIGALDDARPQLGAALGVAKSMAMIGCGYALIELLVVERFMPKLERIVAVEPEQESLDELKERLQSQVPKVRTEICQETLQSWKGTEDPVDVVLMFHCLCHMDATDRAEAFEKLYRNAVAAGGIVVIAVQACCGQYAQNFLCKLSAFSGNPHLHVTEDDIRQSMSAAGFEDVYRDVYRTTFNVENRDRAFASMFVHEDPNSPEYDAAIEKVLKFADEFLADCKTSDFDILLIAFRRP